MANIQKLQWMPSPAGCPAKLITSPCFGAKVLTVCHKMAKGYMIITPRKKMALIEFGVQRMH